MTATPLTNRALFLDAVKTALRHSANDKAMRGEWLRFTEYVASDFDPDHFFWVPLCGYRLRKEVREAAWAVVDRALSDEAAL